MAIPTTVPTPLATKAALVVTLGIAVAAVLVFALQTRGEAVDAQYASRFLALFSALFLLRVAGQLAVRAWRPDWLPPTEQWNLMPYRLLLPIQLAFVALMAWIELDLFRDRGVFATPRPALGAVIVWFSYLYAAGMAVRYVVRMRRRPGERWFGGTIPIVFHWVLAGFLFVFGTFHASR